MPFPNTRVSLIQRLVDQGAEEDWQFFMADYWPATCRYAQLHGQLGMQDAEDVSSETFGVLLEGRLLEKWTNQPNARLRTLIQAVVRKVVANRSRKLAGRKRLLQQLALEGVFSADADAEVPDDPFYAAWVEVLVWRTINSLMCEFRKEGKGDCFRALYGKVCEGLTARTIAESLHLPQSTVENYLKTARRRLTERFRELIRENISKYCVGSEAEVEFEGEWNRLADYLAERGGLEEILRACHQDHERLDAATVAPESASIIGRKR